MPDFIFCVLIFQMYKPLAETKCSFIDNLEDLVAVNEKLAKTSEFAVDLEVQLRVLHVPLSETI